MSETRKLVAILVADVVGYSRLAGAAEDRTLRYAARKSKGMARISMHPQFPTRARPCQARDAAGAR